MVLCSYLDITLPISNPVTKFLIILIIILFAPIVLNKFKIPHLLGLIIAGAIVGPNGLNLIERDSGIILSGTAGLLYIMFLAGLEIDLADFKKNSKKSLIFGMYTFSIPMILGMASSYYLLHFSWPTSILLASMFASHTLITYPLISKLGITKNKAVNITIGGTLITDVLALLVLAVIVGMSAGDVNASFWLRLTISLLIFASIVMFVFPLIGRWFFKHFDDNVSQYIFVLSIVFFGAVLAELAGIEAIIGAFLSGLALNKLIPHTSPLMNRIEFVGSAIFIPFFLIGVGMLIDYRVFFEDLQTLKVAFVMIVIATSSKYLAAWLTQKTFGFSGDERRLIFGLSNAQAAATLAAVLVGYNTIIGTSASGEPVRLLNESVLNGTILMILFTCTVASFAAQKGARNISLQTTHLDDEESTLEEKILIPISNIETTDDLIDLAVTIKSRKNKEGLHALTIINHSSTDNTDERKAKKILNKAAVAASATDNFLHELLRYDINITNGITSVVKEHKITDLILGLHIKKGISDTFLGKLTEGILSKSNTTTFIYKAIQPIGTIKRYIIIIPAKAEVELGFSLWIAKVLNIGISTGAQLVFYANLNTMDFLNSQFKGQIQAKFVELNSWDELLIITREITKNDNLIIVMSRKDKPSYNHTMAKVPSYLNNYFSENSFILVYPMQSSLGDPTKIDLKNPTFMEPFEKINVLGKGLKKIFKRN